jgi:hypothetical protein
MMTKASTIPAVEWISCGDDLPDPGKFVWVVIGRCIAAGEARRYQREVHMGVFRSEIRGFEIFPYRLPMCSNEVWAWAPIARPNVPVCRSKPHEQ